MTRRASQRARREFTRAQRWGNHVVTDRRDRVQVQPPAPSSPTSPSWAWRAVASTVELGDGVLKVDVDGTAWALARLDDTVVAFEDRCPHRLAPLSAGWVEGDTIRCGYHGWAFDPTGRCRLIPAQGADGPIPPRARLQPAPGVDERDGQIWLAVSSDGENR